MPRPAGATPPTRTDDQTLARPGMSKTGHEQEGEGKHMVGITSFGAYLPRLRLARKAIVDAHVWADPALRGKAKGERTMCNWDEDAVTMGVEAARRCLDARPTAPDVIYFASTSAPFADRQNAGIVSTALTLAEDVASVDVGASQRAGTTALMQACAAVQGGLYPDGLVVASDKRRSRAASAAELAWGDGAVALGVGNDAVIARLRALHTTTVDFIDHFRAAREPFDYGWEERWIRDEGLAKIVPPAIAKCLAKASVAADQVDHFIMPSTIARAVDGIAKSAGIRADAVRDNLQAVCGDTGAAHPLVMLVHVLEGVAKAGDIIVVAGFGQGCDVLVFEATDALADHPTGGGVSAALAARQPETNYQKYLAFNELVLLDKGMRAERDDYKTALTVTYRKRDMLLGLVGGRCTQCGTLQFPRSDVCVNPQCKAVHTQEPHGFRDASARVLTWSADYLTYTPDPPSHYGMITFDEGGRFMTDFTDVDVGEVEVGMPVRMMFRIKSVDHQRGFVRYFWKAVPVRAAST
jgi:3-hydroxy-3-methylglutaryl CoA synthase